MTDGKADEASNATMSTPNPIDPRLHYSDYLVRRPEQPPFSAASILNPPTTANAVSHSYYLQQASADRGPPAIDPALGGQDEERATPSENDNDTPVEGSITAASTGLPAAGSPGDSKRERSCDSCRHLKVKCERDSERPDQSCKRCAKARRQCITTPPTRKRQRKADTKVAELEKKIDGLFAQLAAQNVDPPEAKRRRLEMGHSAASMPQEHDGIRQLEEHAREAQDSTLGRPQGKSAIDQAFINRQIDALMERTAAAQIFDRYVTQIYPQFPAVPIAPGTTVEELREKKPLLFLSILAGASFGGNGQLIPPEVQQELGKLLKDIFADVLVRNVEKSLEVVQALQLAVLWYRPPVNFEQHNFYLMANNALLIALDLGLGKRASTNVMKMGIGPFRRNLPDASSIEARRTFLVCYYLCMSITMVLRRPILFRWNGYMEESVQKLETSPEALPSDRVLCQHMRMAHMCERIAADFSMDDPTVDISISDPKITYALSIFENDLRSLKMHRPTKKVDTSIEITEHALNLYIHEIALHHNNNNRADFHIPYPPEAFKAESTRADIAGPAHIAALDQCLVATHGILDTILTAPLDTIMALPIIFCVRSIYALVCLMKMWVTVSSPGELGNIFSKEKLGIESYVDRVVDLFQNVISRDPQSPHAKFFFVAQRLKSKFAQIKEGGGLKGDSTCPLMADDKGALATMARESSTTDMSGRTTSTPNTATQTPLHLLSEVAMGSSGSQQQQQQQQQQQTQQPQQMPTSASASWYDHPPANLSAASTQPSMDNMGNYMGGFDFGGDFDFTSIGMDPDLSMLMYDPMYDPSNLYAPGIAGTY